MSNKIRSKGSLIKILPRIPDSRKTNLKMILFKKSKHKNKSTFDFIMEVSIQRRLDRSRELSHAQFQQLLFKTWNCFNLRFEKRVLLKTKDIFCVEAEEFDWTGRIKVCSKNIMKKFFFYLSKFDQNFKSSFSASIFTIVHGIRSSGS